MSRNAHAALLTIVAGCAIAMPVSAQDQSARARPDASDAAVQERLRRYRNSVDQQERDRATPPATMRPARLYTGPTAPIEVVVRGAPNSESHTLLLLDAQGEVLSLARIEPGRVDLRAALPAIASLAQAAWVQLAQDETPIGAPLVVQPLREPPPVRTMRATRPTGGDSYTKVVGWGTDPLDPADETVQSLRAAWIEGDPPISSGFRTYTEMDAIIRTDHGEVRIAFSPDEAPSTVWTFRTLAREGFFDAGGFHRVVPVDREGRPFVIQGGDPTQTGNGGPGYALALEPSRLPHDYGVISMARADEPHSAGSQFFIALGREGCARLDGQYCAFGYAVDGNRTIDSIAATPIADVSSGRPEAIPKILTIRLVEAPSRMPGIDRRQSRVAASAPAGKSAPTGR